MEESKKVAKNEEIESDLINENNKSLNSNFNDKEKSELIDFNDNKKLNSKKEKKSNIKKETKIETAKTKVEFEKKENDKNKKETKFFYIQLASVSDVSLVTAEWKRLLGIYPDISSRKYEYKKIELNDGKIFYRILLGVFKSKKEALDFCKSTLKKSKCIIRFYE